MKCTNNAEQKVNNNKLNIIKIGEGFSSRVNFTLD